MKISFEINPGWKHIVMKVDGLEVAGKQYSDSEQVRRHPFLMRIRLKLALGRIMHRNSKMVEFWKHNAI